MSKFRPRGKTTFLDEWRKDFIWVEPVENNPYEARCKPCKKSFSVDSMGRSALTSHANGQKHKNKINMTGRTPPVQMFFPLSQPGCSNSKSDMDITPRSTSTATEESTRIVNCPVVTPASFDLPHTLVQSAPTASRQDVKKYLIKDKVTKAEIIWCLNTVMNHDSLRAAENGCILFSSMFPDSEIAKSMQLHKDKVSYTINFGLAPTFVNELANSINKCEYIVIGYDESLNKIAQKQQMDVNIRFWDVNRDEVVTRYLTSVFLSRTTSEDLLQGLKDAVTKFDLSKILQISMDGPNVNFKMLRLFKEDVRSENNSPQLLEMGSCGIHTLHCAFKSAMKVTGWGLIEYLRALYNLWKDSPARRGHYTQITKSDVFPKKFCSVRWLENTPVASRALQILPNVEAYVNCVEKEKKEPQCKSFKLVKEGVRDKLLKAKLAFFNSLADEIEPFMREFQSNEPLAPFLFESLYLLTKNIMSRFIRDDIMEQTNLKKIDVMNPKNLKMAKDVDIGYATRSAIGHCKDLSQKDVLQFRQECRECLKIFVLKIMDRSPLSYPLTKALTCLNPATVSTSGGTKPLKSALDILVQMNILSGNAADKVQRQYKQLCNKNEVISKLKSYNRSETRLDIFWIELLTRWGSDSDILKKFVKMLLILSHGNAALERGFSINKEILAENMKENSLIAQRHIFDAVTEAGGIEKIEISKVMIHSVRNAHARYKEFLAEKKKEKETNAMEDEEKKKFKKMIKELESKKRKLQEDANKELHEIEEKLKLLRKN